MFVEILKQFEWKAECNMSDPFSVMTVRVGFVVWATEKEDEVEFCIHKWDVEELSNLLTTFFFEECGYDIVSIEYVNIVRVADCMEELTKTEEGCEEGLLNDKEAKRNFRLFVDMDGTLTKFIPQDSVNALYYKGYFLNLPPQENVVEAVKIIVKEYPEIEVFVLTAFLADSGYAYMEKKAWLDAVLPQIDVAHRIFVPNGSDKKEYVHNFSNTDVLLDDHTPNLNKWAPARGIKLINDINNKNGSWKGEKVSYDMEPLQLAEKIADIVKGKEGSNANPLTNADRIRQMTLEEMAEWLPIASDLFCNSTDRCVEEIVNYGECGNNEKCAMRWLCSESVWDTKEQIKCAKSKRKVLGTETEKLLQLGLSEEENEEVKVMRYVALTDGTCMGDELIIFKTDAPVEVLKQLEKQSCAVFLNGGNSEKVPNWKSVVNDMGYVFEYIDSYCHVTAYATSGEWLKNHEIGVEITEN